MTDSDRAYHPPGNGKPEVLCSVIGGTIAEYIAAMKCMEPFVYVSSQKDGAAPTVSSRPLVRSS
jgi:hypothetical protein